MSEFLIGADADSIPPLLSAIKSIGGKAIGANFWIAPWDGTADALCGRLWSIAPCRIIVCALSGDWTYR